MNEITCKHEYDNGETAEWSVRWAVTKRMSGATYIHIEGRGSDFDAIVGKYSGGNFICIPGIDVGCGLASFTDRFWNTEKLARYLGETDAVTIAKALEHFGRKERERGMEL